MFNLSLSYAARRAISVGVAMMIAIAINTFVLNSASPWLIITTLLVTQVTRGTPIRQMLLYTVAILLALVFTFFLSLWTTILIQQCIAAFIFIGSMFILLREPLLQNSMHVFFMLLVLLIVIIIFSNSPMTFFAIQDYFVHVLLGLIIGVFCTQLILPVNVNREFNQSILPILKSLQYSSELVTSAFQYRAAYQSGLIHEHETVIDILLADNNSYPEWIYETGFNPRLRAGFRFFLLQIERCTELFFSLQFYLRTAISSETVEIILPSIEAVMLNNKELIGILINYFANHTMHHAASDFTSDMAALEEKVQSVLPESLELLDITQENMVLTAMLRDMKDMRGVLLQLLSALPNPA